MKSMLISTELNPLISIERKYQYEWQLSKKTGYKLEESITYLPVRKLYVLRSLAKEIPSLLII